ncbi:hypothetical protein AAMO2058_000951800 [Amorphochlora amoebiformis]
MGGNKARRKALIGGGKKKEISGREMKKGVKGIASNYIHRTKAVRRLQVSLKDFRRLCILKGIYPRDPKKKPHGNDKTYYHIKDIKFLMHEPLLQKFRNMKAFLKKHKKARLRRAWKAAESLQKNLKPTFNLDHLVKERYPSFVDAVRDLDDPLSMVFLFAMIPSKTCKEHISSFPRECLQLAREFQLWVVKTHALRKVFVSIKGMYYQAKVNGQDVTWIVPHKFKQTTPQDVDFRVMITFLDFYVTLVRFVNFKLYFDLGLRYPPNIIDSKENSGAYLSALSMEEAGRERTFESKITATVEVKTEDQEKLQEKVRQIAGQLDEEEAEMDEEEKEEEEDGEGADGEGSDGEGADGEGADGEGDIEADETGEKENEGEGEMELEIQKAQKGLDDEAAATLVFSGLTIAISREVPQDSLEFVILAGGGQVVRKGEATPEDHTITHEIVDRPRQKHTLFSRQYAQPQWIYDSFNYRTLLPIEHYAPGAALPPHLSPFVDDEKEGYIPKQREVLRSWGGKVGGQPVVENDADEEGGVEKDEEKVDGKELAKIMMTNKHRKLYDKIKFGEQRKEAANNKLRAKRRRLELEEEKAEEKKEHAKMTKKQKK